MIYKFETKHVVLEIELSKAEDEYEEDSVMFSIKYNDMISFVTKSLLKDDVYKLIGALHLLHKEMK